jgi:hypothetical protein
LATPQKKVDAATRVELASSRLQDERSGAVELRRNLVDREGLKPSQEVCRTSMLSLHHQPGTFIIGHWTFSVPLIGCMMHGKVLKMTNGKSQMRNGK